MDKDCASDEPYGHIIEERTIPFDCLVLALSCLCRWPRTALIRLALSFTVIKKDHSFLKI